MNGPTLEHDCVLVERDNLDLHKALADLLAAIQRNIVGVREGGPLWDARARALTVLDRTSRPPCPECHHPTHQAGWCVVTVEGPCEDCGTPNHRCECAVG